VWSKFDDIEIELSNIMIEDRLLEWTVSTDVNQADDLYCVYAVRV